MANALVTQERIEEEVRNALAATLRQEAEKIGLDDSIVEDLGATSIDFLDVNFRLESTFGLQLATQLVLEHVEEELGEGVAIDQDDKITEGAAQLLRSHLGERDGLEAGIYAEEVARFVTPRVLVDSVDAITARLPDACTHCGAADWTSEDGAKVTCSACEKPAVYPDGDELTKEWIHQFQGEHKIFSRA